MPPPSTSPQTPADTILRVALPLPLPRLFDYLPVPGTRPGADDPGRRVQVPFGSRELIGVVAEVGTPETAGPELRAATAVLDPTALFHGELLESLRWLSR
jgi:primosomal protein N' (replication factor Y)